MVGYFIAGYRIGKNMPGAPVFTVYLGINTVNKNINGVGEVTQATNPPLSIETVLNGSFAYMCIMHKECHVLVKLGGVPCSEHPEHPSGILNTDLHMVLGDDWKSGTATYRYRDGGKWVEFTDAPVERVEVPTTPPR